MYMYVYMYEYTCIKCNAIGFFSEKVVQKWNMIVWKKKSTNDPYVTHIKDMVPKQHKKKKGLLTFFIFSPRAS